MHVPRSLATSGPQRPMFVARRRRRTAPALLLGALVVLAIWLTFSSAPISAAIGDGPGTGGTGDVSEPAPSAAPPPDAPDEPDTKVFATYGDLDLHLPTPRPILVGFHEASSPDALEMGPRGTVVENENTTKFEPPTVVDEGGEYLVLSSRGRRQAATSAVDVIMHVDDPVRSPVDGTVTDVREYHLYGSHTDHRIEIRPEEYPDLRLVLIHMDDVEVEVGDELVAGRTHLAGTARPFPFGSQIDRYTEPDRWPHVHIEVKYEDEDEDDEA